MGKRKGCLLASLLCLALLAACGCAEMKDFRPGSGSSGDGAGSGLPGFEPDDVMATSNGEEWQAAKILASAGTGGREMHHVLFADGEEAWVAREYVIRSFRPVRQNELTVGQRVLFTIEDPEEWPDRSIRYAYFSKGKITGLGKGKGPVSVNSYEVEWDKQVLIW
ncbi:MAG TPA: hypothetical protein PK587_04970 [Syntrophales bacterium]|nr:hypothetical protein [Syntrophales bacterium]